MAANIRVLAFCVIAMTTSVTVMAKEHAAVDNAVGDEDDSWLASYNRLKQRPVREFDLLGSDIPMKKSIDRPTREFDSIGSEFIVPDKKFIVPDKRTSGTWSKKNDKSIREFDSIGSEFIVPDKKFIVPDKRTSGTWSKKNDRSTREFDSIGSEFIVPDKKFIVPDRRASLADALRSPGRFRGWRGQQQKTVNDANNA